MMKKTLNTLTASLLMLALSSTYLLAETTETYDEWSFDHEMTSAVEINNKDSISVYNTGLSLSAENESGLSADFRGSIDGKVDEINSKDFELGKFVKELNVNYQINTEDAVLLLSVGKMPTGVKVDRDNPRQVGGVMGVRLGIKPEKIPLIQNWLTKNNFKINRIDIVRYNSESEDRLDFSDLNKTNMTSYALYLSKGHNIQTFFIYKTPDQSNLYGVTSKTLGAVYMMEGKLKPQFFAMEHKSDASFMELDLMVLSAGIEIRPEVRSTFTYSHAVETMSDTKKDIYDVAISKSFKKTKDLQINGSIGVKVENGSTNEKTVYMRLEAKF